MKTIVVSGCDARHDPLTAELMASLQAIEDRTFDIGFIRVGEAPAPASITSVADLVATIVPSAPLGPNEGFQFAYDAIKPRLPELFPGYDVYVWLDGDTWVQNAIGIQQIAEAALLADISAHSQGDPNYFGCLAPDDYTLDVYAVAFGPEDRQRFARFPMVNAGVFGARAQSPLWNAWKATLLDVRSRLQGREQRYYSDQIPLHRLIYSGSITLHPLRAVNNWLALHSLPRRDPETGRLTAPSLPYEDIHILHLVGASKTHRYQVGGRTTSLRYFDVRDFRAGGR